MNIVHISEYTSLKLSTITGKEHKIVLRDIRDESVKIGTEFSRNIFVPSQYIDTQGKKRPMYDLTKKGWLRENDYLMKNNLEECNLH